MATNLDTVMTAVLQCVCERLIVDGAPVCECCQTWSDEPPVMTGCDCQCGIEPAEGQGRAWIRFVNATFSETSPANCPAGVWDVELQVVVYRCVGDMSVCANALAATQKMTADAQSVTAALCLCPTLKKYTPTTVTPIGPAGNCIGVAVNFIVELPTL